MEITLNKKDQQNLEIPELFFNYLKEKHCTGKGTTDTPGILESIRIASSELPYPTSKTYWVVQLEPTGTRDSNIDPAAKTLALGVYWPDSSTMWSRCISVQASVHKQPREESVFYACSRWNVVENNIFGKREETLFLLQLTQGFSKLAKSFLDQLPEV